MTFEEKLDKLLGLQAEIDFHDSCGYPASGDKLLKDFDKVKADLLGDYNLLEGEYISWSALALAWFKWAETTEDYEHLMGEANWNKYKELVDRTIVNVG